MTKNLKILGVLATILCLSLSASAITSRNVVVKQNAQTLKSRSEVKGYFKHRGVTTFRGNDATKQNKIAPIAPSPNRAPAATTGKLPNLIGSVVQSEAGLAVGIYSINENGLTAIKTNYTMNASNGGPPLTTNTSAALWINSWDKYMAHITACST